MNPDDVMKLVTENGMKMVDVKFTDLPGTSSTSPCR